jgi:hypothetical protein
MVPEQDLPKLTNPIKVLSVLDTTPDREDQDKLIRQITQIRSIFKHHKGVLSVDHVDRVVNLFTRMRTIDISVVEKYTLVALHEFMTIPLARSLSESQLSKLFGALLSKADGHSLADLTHSATVKICSQQSDIEPAISALHV